MKKLFWKIIRIISNIFNNNSNNYYNNIPNKIDYEKGSLVDAIIKTAEKYPSYIALEYFNVQITYHELILEIKKCARALKRQGIKENDCVTICMPNTPEAVIAFYAINMIGAVANMIHPLSSENEIEFYLNKSSSKIILTVDICYFKVKNIMENTKIEKVIVSSATKSMGRLVNFIYWFLKGRKIKIERKNRRVLTWNHFIKEGAYYTKDYYVKRNANDLAIILYSGGTTGKPKGIMLSNLNFNASAIQARYILKTVKPGNSILTVLPNFHAFGLCTSIHLPLYSGMKVILVPEFNIKKFARLFKIYKPNAITAVPSLYDAMTKMKFKEKDLSNLSLAVCGGDKISKEAKEAINNTLKKYGSKAELKVGYGLTECSGACCLSPDNIENKEDIIGLPFPDNDIKIVKPNTNEEQDILKEGEICISSVNVMLGYLDEKEETSKVLIKHKDNKIWLHTGDMGYMDENGFIYFKSRIKRMYITSGFNVYPSYIEEILLKNEYVFSCAVIGIPHPYKGEVGKAFIVLKEGINPTIEVKKNIQKHLKKNLSYYAIPAQIKYTDNLPMTLVGKISYKDLH